MGSTLQFLMKFQTYGNILLDRIVTRDESWIHFWMPETKEQSTAWKEKAEEVPRKFKTIPSAGKVMLTIFWDHPGPIYWEFGDDTKSRVSKDTCLDTLNNLRNVIKSKCRGLLSRKLCLLYGNNKPHTTLIKFLLKDFKWEVFEYSSYLLDFATSD